MPYVRQPEEFTPGKPLFFATAMPWADTVKGLLVEKPPGTSYQGRGNPQHPISLVQRISSPRRPILGLYDPPTGPAPCQQWRKISCVGQISVRPWATAREKHTADRGQGLRILSEPVRFAGIRMADSRVTEAVSGDAIGSLRSGGYWRSRRPPSDEPVEASMTSRSGRRNCLALDSDFLTSGPEQLMYGYAREFHGPAAGCECGFRRDEPAVRSRAYSVIYRADAPTIAYRCVTVDLHWVYF